MAKEDTKAGTLNNPFRPSATHYLTKEDTKAVTLNNPFRPSATHYMAKEGTEAARGTAAKSLHRVI